MSEGFAFVLHSHLPYARGAGRWPHGEEWVHEAILGTYLPLLVTLHDLRAADVPFKLTLGLTPTLLEQLADRDVIHRSVEYIDDQIRRAETDRKLTAGQRRELARFYAALYRSLGSAYVARFDRDLVGAFGDLARTGNLELLTSAATHGYLPLLDEASVHLQLDTGRRTTRRLLGIEPTGIWAPECAYRPGLERLLEEHGFTHFFTDAQLILGRAVSTGRMRRSARERHRSGASLATVATATVERPAAPIVEADVFRPYLVADSDVAVIVRHPEVSGQVWSAHQGYPGDPQYREFHRKDERSGLRYWRVTDMTSGLSEKDEYSPGGAAERVRTHAGHFVGLVRSELDAYRKQTGRDGTLVVTFDSELFGHWWFEGVDWLAEVLRRTAAKGPATTAIADRLVADPPTERVDLREGSWGNQTDHSTWLNERTEWIWRELDHMRERFTDLRAAVASDDLHQRALRQAARELLLAQSSDWPFLVTTGQAADYASERFRSHQLRFHRACEIARHGTNADEVELRSLEHSDNPFKDIDPFSFRP